MDVNVLAKVDDDNVNIRVLEAVEDVLGSAKGEEGALEVSVDDTAAVEAVDGAVLGIAPGEDAVKREVCARLETLVKFDLGG